MLIKDLPMEKIFSVSPFVGDNIATGIRVVKPCRGVAEKISAQDELVSINGALVHHASFDGRVWIWVYGICICLHICVVCGYALVFGVCLFVVCLCVILCVCVYVLYSSENILRLKSLPRPLILHLHRKVSSPKHYFGGLDILR